IGIEFSIPITSASIDVLISYPFRSQQQRQEMEYFPRYYVASQHHTSTLGPTIVNVSYVAQ
ncbi:MAG: hypothetical protein EZS28_022236, partial [Streblomastix strix]